MWIIYLRDVVPEVVWHSDLGSFRHKIQKGERFGGHVLCGFSCALDADVPPPDQQKKRKGTLAINNQPPGYLQLLEAEAGRRGSHTVELKMWGSAAAGEAATNGVYSTWGQRSPREGPATGDG